MPHFKKGERLVVIGCEPGDEHRASVGSTVTVLETFPDGRGDDWWHGVEYDTKLLETDGQCGRHSLSGKCGKGHGFYLKGKHLSSEANREPSSKRREW